jgi:hypothetical protein
MARGCAPKIVANAEATTGARKRALATRQDKVKTDFLLDVPCSGDKMREPVAMACNLSSMVEKGMQSSELAFYTTQELIAELMGRQTFCGVVVHSADDHRRECWGEERLFKVHFNRNLDSVRASRLLDTVAEYLDVHLGHD